MEIHSDSDCVDCPFFRSYGCAFDGASPSPSKDEVSRRHFLKLVALVSGGLAVLPLLPTGGYLIPPVPFKITKTRVANVKDPELSAPNSVKIFWYPSQADPEFTNLLIRLHPEDAAKAGREYVAYNRTCIHLRCLTAYLPGARIIGCPCHGSRYRPIDGWPVGGPAALIGRFLPSVNIEIDKQTGDVFATAINLDQIGYGREP